MAFMPGWLTTTALGSEELVALTAVVLSDHLFARVARPYWEKKPFLFFRREQGHLRSPRIDDCRLPTKTSDLRALS